MKADDPASHPVWQGAVDGELGPDAAEASLRGVLGAVRARRRRRTAVRTLAAIATFIVAALLQYPHGIGMGRKEPAPVETLAGPAAARVAPSSPHPSVSAISDADLAARLGRTPYAIVGPPGRQRLIVLGVTTSQGD